MKRIKLLSIMIMTLGFAVTILDVQAMLKESEDLDTKQRIKVQLSVHENGKPVSACVTSQNLYMRNISEDTKDLDCYFQIFLIQSQWQNTCRVSPGHQMKL